MKVFFEEYGFIVLSAIVVILLIGMASTVGGEIESSSKDVVKSFTTKITDKVDNFEIKLDTSNSSPGID